MQVYSEENPKEDTTLRDQLAQERTHLANERTVLAYLRTALAMVVTGISAYHLLNGLTAQILGVITAAVGAFILVLGLARFAQIRARIRSLSEPKSRRPVRPGGP